VSGALVPGAENYSEKGLDSMHTLPSEINPSIGTSTLYAAWNAAIYVAQVEEQRLSEALADPTYLQATQDVLEKHNSLWFNDKSFVISRARN